MKISIKHFLLRRLAHVIVPAGLLISPISAQANDLHHWVSQQDGFYENEDAWVPSQVPNGENDIALFGQQTDLTIGLLSDKTLSELKMANQTDVTLKPGGGVAAGERGDNKSITVENAVVDNAFLRLHSAGANTADVNLRVNDTMDVDGNVHVVNGARINAHYFNLGSNPGLHSRGWVAQSDDATGSSRIDVNTITVGNGGKATFNVETGGLVDSHITYVGRNAPANPDHMGAVYVDGDGHAGPAVWDANALVVGSKAKGQLSAINGGIVNAQTIAFGTGPSNEPEDRGIGSGDVVGTTEDGRRATMNADSIFVGVFGNGTLNVWDGGQLNTKEALLARAPGADAKMRLHSSSNKPVAEWFNEGDVAVGGSLEEAGGSANIMIEDHSMMDVRGEMTIWPNGSVDVNGGTLAANRLFVNVGGQLRITDGTLQLDEYEGVQLVQSGGTIAPGPGAGSSVILEDFKQFGGAKSFFEIGGTEAGTSHDRLAVDGSALIDGTIQLDLIDGFVPAAEDTFSVVLTNQLFGAYQNVSNGGRVATEDGNGSFVVNYGHLSAFDPNQVILSDYMGVIFGDFNSDGILTAADIDMLQIGLKDATFDLTDDSVVDAADRAFWVEEAAGTKLGDANLDKRVDFQDFLTLSNSFGSDGGWADGDFDGNGKIQFPDFLALSANFGQSVATPASVPEPSACFLTLFGLVGVAGFRRKR